MSRKYMDNEDLDGSLLAQGPYMRAMLKITDLHAQIEAEEKPIIKGLNLEVPKGEVHAIMGPNGSGKSTLSYVLTGRPGYDVTCGSATLDHADLLELEPEERALVGLFLAFQYPVEIPGLGAMTFLRAALNARRRHSGEKELDAMEFLRLARAAGQSLGIGDDMLKRAVNVGFSGGEKKRFEALQMALLEPKFAILDETDLGLDIDALRVVAAGVNTLRSPDRGFLVITHYQRLLDYIKPDCVHVLHEGRIIQSGGPELALRLEDEGYDQLIAEAS